MLSDVHVSTYGSGFQSHFLVGFTKKPSFYIVIKTVYLKPLSHQKAFAFYDNFYYYQNALQTPSPCTGFTRRLYSVHTARPQRAHGVLKDLTSLPQRLHSALSNTLCKRQAAAFVLSMFKINAAAWSSMRLHSVFTALLATTQHASRRSAVLWKRRENAALVWQGFKDAT